MSSKSQLKIFFQWEKCWIFDFENMLDFRCWDFCFKLIETVHIFRFWDFFQNVRFFFFRFWDFSHKKRDFQYVLLEAITVDNLMFQKLCIGSVIKMCVMRKLRNIKQWVLNMRKMFLKQFQYFLTFWSIPIIKKKKSVGGGNIQDISVFHFQTHDSDPGYHYICNCWLILVLACYIMFFKNMYHQYRQNMCAAQASKY